ncbi:hypothetical protein PO909_022255, partial [Leuciscus waleckii]
GQAEVNDEWSDDVFQDLVGDLSEWSADVLNILSSIISNFNDNTLQTPVCVATDLSVDIPQESVSLAEDTVSHKRQLEDYEIIVTDINSCSYEIVRKIGEGGFGEVYAGIRLTDDLKVALKFADNTGIKWLDIEGCAEPVPREIGLLILANKGPRDPHIIQLLDWEKQAEQYIMVLERPAPSEDLLSFLDRYRGHIEEDVASVIMQQATLAAQTCCQRGVLHRDIKLENLLINPDTLEVKLIDFGCGEILNNEGYTSFSGTPEYCPPEYHTNGEYHGEPATVWSLGILLFTLLCGTFPESEDLEKFNDNIWTKDGLSQGEIFIQ